MYTVYLDTVTPRAQQVAPPGVPLISHHQLLATHLYHNTNTTTTSSSSSPGDSLGPFSVRGVLLVLDLAQRYPAADWYAEVDDDTFLGEGLGAGGRQGRSVCRLMRGTVGWREG
jgi:hypothetical protein